MRVGEGEGPAHGWPERPIEMEVSRPTDILGSIGSGSGARSGAEFIYTRQSSGDEDGGEGKDLRQKKKEKQKSSGRG